MSINMKKLLEGMIKIGASDLHLKVGNKPTIRLHGILRPIEHPPLAAEDIEEANNVMMPERCRPVFEKIGSADYSYGLSPLERFRVSAYHQRGVVSIALRVINSAIPTFESLNLPPVMEKLVEQRKGLVLVTGITGSGKSTTLSAMISLINHTRREHIITIEDPIEFLYEDDKALIEQIEV
ncbi:Flp pilus assembly complex ATPase component TadA, partial [Candidatus Sumerlaeota bacterium]|nr:Flp pilus assembly complex ATPase component TadA [Candidatus Sumerlaeota bacterium]